MKDKFKAFFIHLLISMGIALISVILVYLLWNPAPLHKATGITHIFLLMLGIDIVIGPLLTFIIYKQGKKTLKMDLVVIAFLQLMALGYGLYHVFEGRPVWIAYNVDRFDLVRANEVDIRKISEAGSTYQKFSLQGPKYVATVLPDSSKDDLMFEEITSGIAPSQRPELYQPLSQVSAQIVSRAQDLKELDKYNDPKEVTNTLSKYPQADSFVPLKANAVDMTVLISKKDDGRVVSIVDLRPWE